MLFASAGVAQASSGGLPAKGPALVDVSVEDVVDTLADGALSAVAADVIGELIEDPVETLDGLVLADGQLAAILPDTIDARAELFHEEGSVIVGVEDAVLDIAADVKVPRLTATAGDFSIHATSTGVQIVNIVRDPVAAHAFALDTEVPDGSAWVARVDGGLDLVGGSGAVIGEIATPWSVDNEGRMLPTWFEISGSRVVQHVDTHGASFPVVSDPSVSVWTKAKCVGSIALLVGGGAVKLLSVVAKIKSLVSASKGFSTAYRALVGTPKFTVGELKYVLGMFKKYAQGNLSKVDQAKVWNVIAQGGAALLAITGLEDCGRWWGWVK